MKIKNDRHKRYNRRRDGVTTVQSTPERHKLEESRLKEQWDEFWHKEIEALNKRYLRKDKI